MKDSRIMVLLIADVFKIEKINYEFYYFIKLK